MRNDRQVADRLARVEIANQLMDWLKEAKIERGRNATSVLHRFEQELGVAPWDAWHAWDILKEAGKRCGKRGGTWWMLEWSHVVANDNGDVAGSSLCAKPSVQRETMLAVMTHLRNVREIAKTIRWRDRDWEPLVGKLDDLRDATRSARKSVMLMLIERQDAVAKAGKLMEKMAPEVSRQVSRSVPQKTGHLVP